jgi:hypothetical protein
MDNRGGERTIIKGTRQIGVILHAKKRRDPASTPPATTSDQLPVEDVLPVEHDVVPLDGAHMLQE